MTASAGTRSSATEHTVLAAVRKEFDWTAELDASQVAIGINGSVLTLAGEVTSLPQVGYATKAALRVRGVSSVANDITVHVPFKAVQPDREIATAVFESIFWTAGVPRDRIKIVVTDQVVTLSGELDWNFQRQEADRVARRIVGVREVRNDITLPERPTASDTAAHIRSAFLRSATVDAKGIAITVDGNVVTLSGEVRSSAQKLDAGRGAWSSPHVTDVRNLISVKPM